MSSSFGRFVGQSAARWALGLVTGLTLAVGASAAAPPLNTIAFSTNIYVVYDTFEGDYYVTNLYGGNAVPVSVDYVVDVANPTNTAVYGVDYFLNPGTVTFQAGVFETNFVVQILPTATAGRTLCLRLSNPTPPPAVLSPTLFQAELRIVAEPPPRAAAGEFSFSRALYMITDQEGPDFPVLYPPWGRTIPGALVTINRTNGSVGRVSVDFTATSLADPLYLETGRIFFDDGQTSTNFVLFWPTWPLLAPVTCPYALPAGAEGPLAADTFVNLQLSNPLPDALENPNIIQPILGGLTQADLWVVGTGKVIGQASLTSLHTRVDEYGNRLAHVTVYLHGGGWTPPPSVDLYMANFPFGLPLDESSDYALAPLDADLSGLNGGFTRYTFPPGVTAVTHVIPVVIPDTLVEFNEDLRMWLELPPPGIPRVLSVNPLAGAGNANSSVQGIVTILFDDQPPGAADREWAPQHLPNTMPPFNPTPGANNQVQSVAVQPDGRTVMGGDFTGVHGTLRNRIARLNFDGSLDTNFCAHPNTGADNYVSKVQVLSDGVNVTNILIAGGFTSYNGTLRRGIARLLPDGVLDTTFFTGAGANGPIRDMAVQGDGKIVIVGDFTRFNETDRFYVARLNPDGSLDATFTPGTGADDVVLAVGFDSDQSGGQKIYIGGRFTHYGGVLRNRMARLNENGTLDTTFDPGQGVNGPVFALARQADGKMIFAGHFSLFNAQGRGSIVRVNTDGSLDTSFVPRHGSDDSIYAIAMHPDGRAYIGGVFRSYNDTRRWGLALLRTDGTLDTRFMDQAYNQFAGVPRTYAFQAKPFIKTIALQPDGNLLVGGSFTNLGGNTPVFYNDYHTSVGINTNYPLSYPENPPWCSVWTRQDKIDRHNVARLIGTWGLTTNGVDITANPEQGPGNVEFIANDYLADESKGMEQVTVTRVDGLLGTAIGLAATSNRTATAGLDFSNQVDVAMPFYELGSGPMHSDGYPGPVYFEVPILEDTLVEGNEVLDMGLYLPQGSITLGYEIIPLGVALGRSSATLTIVDNDYYKGTFVFSSPTYTVTENQNPTNAILTVVRTNGSDGAVSVDYYTVDVGAQAGRDYRYTSNRLDFSSGETSKTIQVPVINDTSVENYPQTFLVILTNAVGGAILPGGTPTSTTSALVTIIDRNYLRGRINFNPTNYVVDETDGVVMLSLERVGGSLSQITNSVVTRSGTALPGINYSTTSTNLVWLSGDAGPKTVTVPILSDGAITLDRSFTVSITNATVPLDVGFNSNAVVRIVNNDHPGSNFFSQALYLGDENGTNVTITVQRRGGVAGTNTVRVTTQDDTAVAGTDYIGITNMVLTFPPGVVSASFDVRLIDNALHDGSRTFGLLLHHATNSTVGVIPVGEPSQAQFVIVDDESVVEPAGSLDVTFNIGFGANRAVYALQLQPDTNLLVGGAFTTYDNIPENSMARVQPDGDLDTTFNVNAGFNDQLRAMVLQPDGKVVMGGFFTSFNGVNRARMARLHHDGSLDEFFNPGAGADSTVFAIAVQPNDGRILVGGEFNTFNGDRRPNLARLNTNGTLHTAFNAGNGPDGPVYAITLQPDGKILIGGAFTNVNDVPRRGIARLWPDGRLDTTFTNGAGADAAVRAIAVQSDGRILVGGSFTNFAGTLRPALVRLEANGSVDATFLSGLLGPNDAVYAITIQMDEKILVGGAFTKCNNVTRNRITRLNKDGTTDPSINFGLGANGFVASIVVQPDRKIILGGGFTSYDGYLRNNLVRIHGGSLRGSGVFEFSTPYFTAVENMPVALVQVMRRGGTFGPVAVNYMTFDGTATDGRPYSGTNGDYLGTDGTTLSFPQGEVLQEIALPIIDDSWVEDPETLYILLASLTDGNDIGSIPMSILTIISDDATLGFDNNFYYVSENTPNGAAAIRVVRQGDTNGTLQVEYSAFAGTATSNDFVAVLGILYFGPGVTDQMFLVPIIDDVFMDGNLTVMLALTNALPANTVSLVTSNAVLTIVENEGLPGVLGFNATNYFASEFASNALITVIRTNGTRGIVSVGYSTGDGTATNGIDYRAVSGVLSFADGETVKTFYVPMIADHQPGPDKTVNLRLFNPGGGAVLGEATNATLTVVEGDLPPFVSFATTNFLVNEYETNATITVIRRGPPTNEVRVQFCTTNGTALEGINYVGVTNSPPWTNGLVWTNGDGEPKTFTVSILHDFQGTSNLVVNLVLFSPIGTSLGGVSNATLTIMDEDVSPRFASSNFATNEAAGNIVITVRRVGTTNDIMTVDYATVLDTNMTAVAGLDYTPVSGTLTWLAGDAVPKTFLVPIMDNTGVNTDRTFRIALSNVTGTNAYLAPPSNAVVTILNDDVFAPPSGGTDPTFGDHWGANSNVHAVAFDPMGRLYAGGEFTFMHGLAQSRVARLTTNDVVDTSFAIGTGFDDTVFALAPNGNDLLAVGGSFRNYNGLRADRVALLMADGQPSPAFNPTNVTDGTVRALAWVGLSTVTFATNSALSGPNSHTNDIALTANSGVISANYTFMPPAAPGANQFTNTFRIYYSGARIYQTNIMVQSNLVTGSVSNLAFGPGPDKFVRIVVNEGLTNGTAWNYAGNVLVGGAADRKLIIGGDFLLAKGEYRHRIAQLNPNGSVDLNFNVGDGANNTVYAVAALPNGQVLAGGNFTAMDRFLINRLARLNADGSVDITFNPGSGYGADSVVRSIAVQPDGAIMIAGDFLTVGGVPRYHVARLQPNGAVDLAFDPGLGASDTVYSLSLQEDGRVIVVGNFTSIGGNDFARVARLNGDGSVDTSFNPGSGVNALVRSSSILTTASAPQVLALPTAAGTAAADSRTYETGTTNGTLTIDYSFLVRTNDLRVYYNGFLIYELATNGVGQTPPIQYGPGPSTQITIVMNELGGLFGATWTYTATVTSSNAPDIRVAVGGDFTQVNGQPRRRVAVLNGSGNVMPSFDPGAVGNVAVYALAVYTNKAQPALIGKIVAGGDFTSVVGAQQNRLVRLHFDGTIDTGFNIGLGPDLAVQGVALQPDGKVIAGGNFTNVNSAPRYYLARFLTNGLIDPTYNSGIGPDNAINALALQSDGRLYIGGIFTRVYGVSRNGIARMKADGTVDTSFAPGTGANNGSVKALALHPNGVNLYVGGDFASVNSIASSARVARLFTDGVVDTSFASPLANGVVNAVAIQADGKVLVGGTFFLVAAGRTNYNLARLESNGTADASFNAGSGPNDYVSSITIQPNGLILVGGGFTVFNGQMHNRLVRLASDGSFDGTANFGLGANNFISAIALQDFDGKIVVGGAFTEFDSQVRIGVARLFGGTNVGPGAFQFSAPVFSASEDASNAVVTVVRRGGASGAAQVSFATSDGTALAGRDYLAASGVLNFATGESFKTISVGLINNFVPDGTRSFNVMLSNPGGGATLGASNLSAVVNILDDEAVISFSVSEFTVLANAGSARVTVIRTGGTSRTVTVDCFTTTNGTAVPLLDYLPSAATLVFNPGVSAQTFYVPVINNLTIDPAKTVPLVLSNVTGPAVLGLANATLTILDDQVAPGVLSFVTNSFDVNENDGTATITVVRTGGYFGAISVRYLATNLLFTSTATPGADYWPVNGVLTFADGETNKTFTVAIINDSLPEGRETVDLQLSGATGGAVIGVGSALLTIRDDETASFAFEREVFTANEALPAAAVTVIRNGGTNFASSVTVRTAGGTAVAGVDYTPVSNVLQFAVGELSKVVIIPLAHNSGVTGTKTVGLLLSDPTPTNTIIGVPGSATLQIYDSESSFTFTTNSYFISESNTSASITVERRGNTNAAAFVSFSTTSGSAVAGLDFVNTNGTVSFTPGQTVTNFFVRILRNTQATGDRSLNLTLSAPPVGASLGPIVLASLTIQDMDVAVGFSAANYTTNESAIGAVITVVRSGATNSQLSVVYATSDGSATSAGLNPNYFSASGTLTFLPGQVSTNFTVFLFDNAVAQGDVTVNLTLSNPAGGVLGSQPTAVLTIQDNDVAVGFSATNYVVNSLAGSASVTVVRRGVATSNEVSVFLITSNGTALAGVDYVRFTNVIRWAANDMAPKTNIIQILDDGVANGVKTANLYLLNPSTNTYADPGQATLSIVDNGGSIAFSTASASVIEGTNLVITLVRTGGSNGIVSVEYNAISGNATPGVDFSNPSGLVTFADGETAKNLVIPVPLDGQVEGLETAVFALSNALGGARIGGPSQLTLTITDGDLGVLQAAGSALVTETNGNGMIDPNEVVTVQLGLRNIGYVNTVNLQAVLLSTNLLPGCGIVMTNSLLAQTQAFGAVVAGGSVVSKPFTFRAVGTNGGQIVATLVLTEGGFTNGVVTYAFTLGGSGTTVGPANAVTIPASGMASPYPSVLHVAGLAGKVRKVTVTLFGLQHAYAPDFDMMLVGPQGQNVMLMSDAGGFSSVNNVTLTFDDLAANPIPYNSTITNGTYRPANYEGANDNFPAPGPSLPPPDYGTNLAVFKDTNPNGDWKLFIVDDQTLNAGSLAGWSLTISNSEPVASVADLSVKMVGTPNPVPMNGRLTYTLAVTNHGPGTASNVVVTDFLPPNVTSVASSLTPAGAGSVAYNVGLNTVVANVSRLTVDQGVLVTISVTVPGNATVLTNAASVAAFSTDQYLDNNSDSVKTLVAVAPNLGVTTKEGNIQMSWSTGAGNFVLVSAPTLFGPWTEVPNIPPAVNGVFTVTLSASSGNVFYRLRWTP